MNILTYPQVVNNGRMMLEALEAKNNKDGFKCLVIIRGLGIDVPLNIVELQYIQFSKTDETITVCYDNKKKSTLVTKFPIQLYDLYKNLVTQFNEKYKTEIFSIQKSAINVAGDFLPNFYSVWEKADYQIKCDFLQETKKIQKQKI